ncbi:MAG: hypothetical protein DYG94_09560 [Leptolyngbya sp. PLA3]|nr:hypothetical protein [Leptolyngbya sp. PL-A3]
MTEVIRSTHMGQFHGGAWLINLESGQADMVLSWSDGSIDFEGRGGMRGLRGIAFHNSEIYIAAHDELFVFDRDFNKLRSFPCRNLTQVHEICSDGRTLYLTSTKQDSIVEFDLSEQKFTRARLLVGQKQQVMGKRGPAVQTVYRTVAFDPLTESGPPPQDLYHINSVWCESGKVYIAGVRLTQILELHDDGCATPYADVPEWTHNARPFRMGCLYNSTEQDAVVWADKRGKALVSMKVPKYAESQLVNANLPRDIARQGFARGLCLTSDGLVIAGSSPSTIAVHDLIARKTVKRISVTMDVRHAPHGLEIWPF